MKKFMVTLIAIMLVISLAACGSEGSKTKNGQGTAGAGNENGGEKQEVVFQLWITPNLTKEYYDGIIKKFEAVNPDIKVTTIQPPANEGTPDNYLKTLLAAGDFPDIIQNATTKLFVDADALLEIPVDSEIEKINNYQNDFIDGKLYNISPIREPHSFIFYNKKLFADAGITALPTTWAELEAVSAKLKEKGITPLLGSGDWVSGFQMSLLTSPTVYKDQPNWYADRYDDKVKFSDPGWMEAAQYYAGLVNKGYFNKGVLSIDYAAVEQEFLKGNGAMYPMGVWFSAAEAKAVKDFEVGVFPAPTKDGSKSLVGGENVGGYSVSKNSKNPEAALKFAKYIALDPEALKGFLQADGSFSSLKDPVQWDMSPLQLEIAEMLKDFPLMSGHWSLKAGKIPVSGLQNQYDKVAQNILLGNADVAKEMQSLDEYWDKNEK
ncbi:ABC transporter substrate-binding protein [Paenibacillus eucommiae]|uniref:ABC-type glycerol-3-phosphate transport system substrate-binding protein n=1 Tax=Paenibacillus eucommiae TaxID=1355755 RepID=A0ABS4IPX4_9BACL|nr:extracellular solute-binding protein [Paenibacillus eucommiae]MBP1988664.1 ABC-type glycerol-3-phosphate transport system substrate-binding protein [Paenibacillus eucommiae]